MIDPKQVINKYGKILELTFNISASAETFLPYSKKEIKNAILNIYSLSTTTERQILAEGYILLSRFVSTRDALIVKRFEEWITNNLNKKYPKDSKLKDKYFKIQKEIIKDAENLRKEISKIK